jgi:NLI interacting factor-like phosphatase
VATKYEMHVYTMGTRAYAEEVCKAIDPDGKFFGGRILSRDESGSKPAVLDSPTSSVDMLPRSHTEELTAFISCRHINGCHH